MGLKAMKYSVAEPLVDPYEAVEIFLKELGPLKIGCEEIFIEDSLGRVACSDIVLPIPLPPFPRSLVDGYAVLYSDVASASKDRPVRLSLAGRIGVGASAEHVSIKPGTCYEVATGSHLPRNTDLVVPFEDTEEKGSEVIIYSSPRRGENIAYPGSDLPSGTVIVKRGWVIDEKTLAALASAGIKKISVYRKPRVCVMSTGRELLEPGEPLRPGMVYESNLRSLKALLESRGFDVEPIGIVGDDIDDLRRAILSSVERCDLVVTTGGTSAGVEDNVYRVVGETGRIIVRGVKLRPGKPTSLGIVKEKPVVSISGNPVAVFVLMEMVLPRLLRRIKGEDEIPRAPSQGRARLLRRIKGSRGRIAIIPSILVKGSGGLFILPWVLGSYMISRLSLADVYIEIHYSRNKPVEVGEEVEYKAFGKDPRVFVLEASEISGGVDIVGDRLIIYSSREEAEMWLSMGAASSIHVCEGYRIDGDRVSVEMKTIPEGKRYGREFRVLTRDRIERVPGYGEGSCFSRIVGEILRERSVEEYVSIDVDMPSQARDMFVQGLVDVALEPL